MAIPEKTPPAAPWALLWLTGFTGVSWLALILSDRLAGPPQAAAVLPGPDRAPAAPAGAPDARDPLAPKRFADASPLPPAPEPGFAGPAAAVPPLPARWGGVSPSAPLQERWPASPVAPSLPAFAPAAGLQATAAQPPGPGPYQGVGGALLLGGPLDLSSLNEKPMVPAARVEQARRRAAADRLQALPLHWRSDMQALLRERQQEQVMPADVVRLPAPHLSRPEEIPLAVRSDGADTTVQPASGPSMQALERWVSRQTPPERGQVRPVVVVLEPISPATAAADTISAPPPAPAPLAAASPAPVAPMAPSAPAAEALPLAEALVSP